MTALPARCRNRLSEVDGRLARVVLAAAERMPLMVICGYRDRAAQDAAVKAGNSKLPWPRSKHNRRPALAVDIAPLPLDWQDVKAFERLGAVMLDEAKRLGVGITWGGSWRMRDLPHFEITKP